MCCQCFCCIFFSISKKNLFLILGNVKIRIWIKPLRKYNFNILLYLLRIEKKNIYISREAFSGGQGWAKLRVELKLLPPGLIRFNFTTGATCSRMSQYYSSIHCYKYSRQPFAPPDSLSLEMCSFYPVFILLKKNQQKSRIWKIIKTNCKKISSPKAHTPEVSSSASFKTNRIFLNESYYNDIVVITTSILICTMFWFC